VQTNPPTIPIRKLYPAGNFPMGELCQYKDEYAYLCVCSFAFDARASNLQRETSAEVRAREMLMDQDLKDLRQAAEAHRQVCCQYVSTWLSPWRAGAQVRAVVDQARNDDDRNLRKARRKEPTADRRERA
jgi:hypothetical protein